MKKKERVKFKTPRNIQECIPVDTIYKDGIFVTGKKYSKCYKFDDINYAIASRPDKESIFIQYSELLNALDNEGNSKITILNRKLNEVDFEEKIQMNLAKDKLDKYRKEYNNMLLEKSIGSNSIIQEKYLTITTTKKNIDDARIYFQRISTDLTTHFNNLNTKCYELNAEERLRLIHNFYRIGEESLFTWNLLENIKRGNSFKDYICPDSFSFKDDYFEMGNKFGRVLFLKDYANYIKDDFVSELTDINKNLILSIDVKPIPTDVAIRKAENIKLGVETNITNWQRRQNNNNNFSAVLPYDMELSRKEVKEFLEDLTTRDQRMFLCGITLVIVADSKEDLDNDTDSLLSVGRKHLCQLAILKWQQVEGLATVMPFGDKYLDIERTLTTEALGVFMPFRVQDINHQDGIYYGNNVISKNMILANRKELLNGNSFILGVSGSGKSFTAKNEIVSIALRDPKADILIIDPEREYYKLVEALGGECIDISATSNNHINAMDINSEYGDGNNPVIFKSEFILSLCSQIIGNELGPKEKSIIDRCTANIYRDYQKNGYKGKCPTLKDFREELLKQPEQEANQIALALDLYITGSLDTFAKETNVNTKNRIVCYDILDLGSNLLPVGMLIVLDNILNRITLNRAKGRNTYIFIDEIYLLFKNDYAANFLFTLWKRVRKYGAYCTGITQNVDDLLQSHTARTMLANSEFLVMLNQSTTDSIELAKLLNISDSQKNYITNVDAGEGLIKIGKNLVPFKSEFPNDTELYKLMTTKPGE